MALNFLLLSALSASIVLIFYISSPFIQVTFSQVTNRINPGINLPDIGIIGPADPTPYTCTKDPSKGPATCKSDVGSVRDGVRLWIDADKVCVPNTLSCGDKGCSCQWNN